MQICAHKIRRLYLNNDLSSHICDFNTSLYDNSGWCCLLYCFFIDLTRSMETCRSPSFFLKCDHITSSVPSDLSILKQHRGVPWRACYPWRCCQNKCIMNKCSRLKSHVNMQYSKYRQSEPARMKCITSKQSGRNKCDQHCSLTCSS